MPFPNEHAARVRSPGDFIEGSFRRKKITDGVTLIVGRLKGGEGSAVAQSYRFDREVFTAREARAWLKEHDVTVQLFEEATGEEKAIRLGTAVIIPDSYSMTTGTKQEDPAPEPLDDVKETAEKSTLDGEVSREQQEMAVRQAFMATVQPMMQVAPAYPSGPYIVDTYTNSVICEWAGKFYEVPFMRVADGIAFAAQEDWAEIEKREEWLRKVKELKTEAKAGRRVRSEKIGILKEIKAGFDGLMQKVAEVLGWAEYEDRENGKQLRSFKTFKGSDGRDWLLTWTTNAFEDRDGEIFETKAIEEYVSRHDEEDVKGEFQFWHLPGSKFGDIRWQGVSGRFLAEAGPFDETKIGQAFKAFFQKYPDGHPAIAPEGWGASHGFKYRAEDRKGGVYRWFEKQETSVLPGSVAANPYNPELEVIQMLTEKQIQALDEIGGQELVKLVTETGEKRTQELEQAGIAHKAKKNVAETLRAMADEMDDEGLAKEIRGLAEKVAKSVAKGSKEKVDIPEAIKALAEKAEGSDVEKLKSFAADLAKPPEEPAPEPPVEAPVTRAEIEEAIGVIGGAVAGLAEQVKALRDAVGTEVKREVKETLEETPRMSLKELAAKSVIGNPETKVDGRTSIVQGPKETDPQALPEGRVFGIPLLDALKAAGQRQPGK